jgi:hypothetical protein
MHPIGIRTRSIPPRSQAAASAERSPNVRFGSKADVTSLILDVCITPESGHSYVFMSTRPSIALLVKKPALNQFRHCTFFGLQSCLSHSRPATLGGIFLAIDRRNMRGVSIEIRAPDPKLLLVRIDPLPQLFA